MSSTNEVYVFASSPSQGGDPKAFQQDPSKVLKPKKHKSVSQNTVWGGAPDMLVVHSPPKYGPQKALKGLKKNPGKLQKKSSTSERPKKSKGLGKSAEKYSAKASYVLTEIGTTCDGIAICKLMAAPNNARYLSSQARIATQNDRNENVGTRLGASALLLAPRDHHRIILHDQRTSFASSSLRNSTDVDVTMNSTYLFFPNNSTISAHLPWHRREFPYLSVAACPTQLQQLPNTSSVKSVKTQSAKSSALCACGFGFAASESPFDASFIAHHNYEMVIAVGLTKEVVQRIVDDIEAAIGNEVFTAFSNCTHSLRKLAPNTLISNYTLAPADEAASGNCPNLQATTENTTCVVVHSSSTVHYNTRTDYANEADIQNAIMQVVHHGCQSGSFVIDGALKCKLLVSSHNATGIGGLDPTFVGSVTTTGQAEAKNNILSLLGASMVATFAFGILVVVLLAVRRRISSVATKEEPVKCDDVVLAEGSVAAKCRHDDVSDASLTNCSQFESSDDHSTLNGEQIFADLKPVDGNVTGTFSEDSEAFFLAIDGVRDFHLCKSGCSNSSPFITKDGQVEVHVCNLDTCLVCSNSSRRKGIEPFTFETYMPSSKLAASKPYNNTVTL